MCDTASSATFLSLTHPPLAGYFAGALTRAAIKQFFTDVAEASPIPILVYNYPGASAGIDIDSELMSESASRAQRASPSRAKLTYTPLHSRAKLFQHCWVQVDVRQRGQVSPARSLESLLFGGTCALIAFSFRRLSRLTSLDNFAVLGGFADFMSAGLFLDGAGCITGLANLAPVREAFFLSFAPTLDSSPSLTGRKHACNSTRRLQIISSHRVPKHWTRSDACRALFREETGPSSREASPVRSTSSTGSEGTAVHRAGRCCRWRPKTERRCWQLCRRSSNTRKLCSAPCKSTFSCDHDQSDRCSNCSSSCHACHVREDPTKSDRILRAARGVPAGRAICSVADRAG